MKTTFADIAASLKKKVDSYNKVISNPKVTALNRMTAERNLKNVQAKLAELADLQEEYKGNLNMDPTAQYKIGGQVKIGKSGLERYDGPKGTVTKTAQIPVKAEPEMTPRYTPLPYNDEPFMYKFDRQFTPGEYNPNWMPFAAPAINLVRGAVGQPEKMPYDPLGYVTPITMDISNQVRDTQEVDIVNRRNISNLSPQQIISGQIGSGDWRQKAIARLETEKQMFDAQDRARAEGVNLGIDKYNRENQRYVNEWNAAARSARDNMINAGLAGLSEASQNEFNNKLIFNQMENERRANFDESKMRADMLGTHLQDWNRRAINDRNAADNQWQQAMLAFNQGLDKLKESNVSTTATGSGGGNESGYTSEEIKALNAWSNTAPGKKGISAEQWKAMSPAEKNKVVGINDNYNNTKVENNKINTSQSMKSPLTGKSVDPLQYKIDYMNKYNVDMRPGREGLTISNTAKNYVIRQFKEQMAMDKYKSMFGKNEYTKIFNTLYERNKKVPGKTDIIGKIMNDYKVNEATARFMYKNATQ